MTAAVPRRIRVLVVDDSVAIRKLLTAILSSDPALEVVGTAGDGRAALAAIETLAPDVMTLDIEMPILDGLATLRELRQRWLKLPVIMLSTLTVRGGEATLDALTLGANDYVSKPAQLSSREAAVDAMKTQLIPKIKALHAKYADKTSSAFSPASIAPDVASLRAKGRTELCEIVAIGISTGGPNALALVLPALPADLAVPIVVVQHIPPVFSTVLAQRLNATSKVRVVEAVGGESLDAGVVYIAPGNQHLVVAGTRPSPHLELLQSPPENSCRPSADTLMRSVARIYGSSALAVVMTGMGQDGVEGCREIRQAGGQVIVQDEATSVVWGMPGLVYKAGLAHGVFPLGRIAAEIESRTLQPRRRATAAGKLRP